MGNGTSLARPPLSGAVNRSTQHRFACRRLLAMAIRPPVGENTPFSSASGQAMCVIRRTADPAGSLVKTLPPSRQQLLEYIRRLPFGAQSGPYASYLAEVTGWACEPFRRMTQIRLVTPSALTRENAMC